MMVIENKFNLGQIVYLKTDEEQSPRIVTIIQISGNDLIYQLAKGAQTSCHFGYEISTEKNILITTTD